MSSFDSIWGVDDTSSIVTPSPNTGSSEAAIYTSGQLNCDAINDGLCATNNIFAFYGANGDVASFCKSAIDGYLDWYVPAICELGPFGSTGENTGDYPSLPGSQTCLSSDNIQDNLMGIPNFSSTINMSGPGYFSSMENSANPMNNIWGQGFSSVASGTQAGAVGDKFSPSNILRCTRKLTI